MTLSHIKISVVIPTVGNIQDLKKAINSVLKQTYEIHEIIIVVDGISDVVKKLCKSYNNDKIKLFETIIKQGGAFARNFGIRCSTGDWVALLDDDDEWLPDKLLEQIRFVEEYHQDSQFFSFTKVKVVNNTKTYMMPRKSFLDNDSIASYLFKTRFGRIQGFIQTSTFLAPRSIYIDNPFNENLLKHQDWDFAMSIQRKGIPIIYVDKVLSIYNNTRLGVGSVNRWEFSLEWIDSLRDYIDECAYQDFLIQFPIKDMLCDSNLPRRDRIKIFFELNSRLDFYHKLSLKQLLNFKTLFMLQYKLGRFRDS